MLSRRQKTAIIALVLYWPAIFIGTHMRVVPRWVSHIGASDKTLHYFSYLVLSFLLWFAISLDKKVKWNRPTVWWILLVVAIYGAIDEWLQIYVGRNADVIDFSADLTGAVTGLVLLSIFSFWPLLLALTGMTIFISTNLIRANINNLPSTTNGFFHLFAYSFFSLVWAKYMRNNLSINSHQPRWFIGALAFPLFFLGAIQFFMVLTGNSLQLKEVLISVAGIIFVAVALYMAGFLRRSSIFRSQAGDV